VGLSMRRLGATLGVEAMALYRHFPEKEAILDEVVDRVLAGLEMPAGVDWQDNLRSVAWSLRERLLLHPNTVPLVAARRLSTPLMRGLVKRAKDDMTAQGISPDCVDSVIHAILSFVLGHSWLEVGGYVGEIPEADGLARKPVEPSAGAAGQDRQEVEHEEFDRGLTFLISGAALCLIGQRVSAS